MATTVEVAPVTSVDGITKDWIGRILSLKNNSAVTVQALEIKPPDSKYGFSSDICFVNVDFKVDCSTKHLALVVKIMSHGQQTRTIAKRGSFAKREISFYENVISTEFSNFCYASGLAYPLPEVYWSCLTENALNLILSDLSSKGYQVCLTSAGNNLQQVKCALSTVAVIHAYGFAAVAKHGKEHFHVPFDRNFLDDNVCNGLRFLVKLYEGKPLADIFTSLIPLHLSLISTCYDYPLIETLIHGDLYAANIMFTHDDKVSTIIDWQFSCVCNPLCDFTSMLLSADPVVFEEHLDEVLDCYWRSFTNALIANDVRVTLKYEDLVNNLEKLWLHGFMLFIAGLPNLIAINKMTEERTKRVVSFIEKTGAFSAFLKFHKR